jgi:hypothetical protein
MREVLELLRLKCIVCGETFPDEHLGNGPKSTSYRFYHNPLQPECRIEGEGKLYVDEWGTIRYVEE